MGGFIVLASILLIDGYAQMPAGFIVYSFLKTNVLSRNRTLLYAAALIIIDIAFFGMTNPSNLSSPILFMGFSLIVVTLFVGIRALRVLVSGRIRFASKYKHVDGYIAAVLSLSLALSSLGQLSLRDFVLLTIAAIALYWYVGYQKSSVGA